MKRKIMELNHYSVHLEVIMDDAATVNPYRILTKWYDCGWHQKTLEKYGDLNSVLCYVYEYCRNKPCFYR